MDKRGGGRRRKGVSQFSVENFLSHSAENFRRGTFCAVFQKVSGSQKILWIRAGGGGVSVFSVENFLSRSAEKIRR